MRTGKRGFQPINFLFGLMMGTADVVPGVSGGTVALIVGIYERLIASIRAAATGAVKLLRLRGSEGVALIRSIEWGLVLPLAAGILTALVIGARIIPPLREAYPVQFNALFFGLITASLAIPWKRMRERRGAHYAAALTAGILAFVLVGFPPRALIDPPLVLVFLAASIAICAMILPGVSGAYLLLVMGMYDPTLAAVHPLNVAYVAVFGLGAIIGLGAFSKVLNYLLQVHHDVTMATLVGLMAGSLRALWPFQDDSRALLAPPSPAALAGAALLAAFGFAIVFLLTRVGEGVEGRSAGEARPR
jgi:putative membrane protein